MPSIATSLVLFLSLCFLIALCSVAESALRRAQKWRLRDRAGRGDRGARAALEAAADLDRFRASVRLIVAFATLRGEPAYDGGTEPNSPFTAAFLKHVETDGMDIDRLFRLVTADVKDATRGMQHPEIVTRRSDRPYLLANPAAASR